MDVGIQTLFSSHGWDGMTDGQVLREETQLALLADELGFDVVWAVEHHFYDYSFCPDNTVWLASIAARTTNVDVGTAAVIMPWNEPLRVAEKIALLDHIAGGRLRFGMGRGLSRREYSHFRGRTYAVATSDDSLEAAARLKAAMVMFADRSWEGRLPSIEKWRAMFSELNDDEPPPPLICDFVYCHSDAGVADEVGPGYLATYLESVLEHYEIMGDHFIGTAGYEAYAGAARALRRMGASGFLEGFLDATAYGTPEQIIGKYRSRWELLGPFEAAPAFRFGGIPYDQAEASMRLFASEVLPELASWT
jgi:alkanesulfonate monooxygenase SsuD/methylene tetrahydromethanopterin reductase-like flavin-dependent oxidoreductase (luciferase family)